MRTIPLFATPFIRLLLALTIALANAGCAIKLVADYDSAAFEEILAVGKKVDKLYGTVLDTDEGGRNYSKFSEAYVTAEAEIRSMVTRNQARALNSESTEISKKILTLFEKYKQNHKANDGYRTGVAKLDRNRLARMFGSAASAEEAKKLSADDKDTEKESK